MSNEGAADLVALDDALTNLATIDPRKAEIVELKYFGGMTIEEAAEVLEVFNPDSRARLAPGKDLVTQGNLKPEFRSQKSAVSS